MLIHGNMSPHVSASFLGKSLVGSPESQKSGASKLRCGLTFPKVPTEWTSFPPPNMSVPEIIGNHRKFLVIRLRGGQEVVFFGILDHPTPTCPCTELLKTPEILATAAPHANPHPKP